MLITVKCVFLCSKTCLYYVWLRLGFGLGVGLIIDECPGLLVDTVEMYKDDGDIQKYRS